MKWYEWVLVLASCFAMHAAAKPDSTEHARGGSITLPPLGSFVLRDSSAAFSAQSLRALAQLGFTARP